MRFLRKLNFKYVFISHASAVKKVNKRKAKNGGLLFKSKVTAWAGLRTELLNPREQDARAESML